jgi:hypothetical protein
MDEIDADPMDLADRVAAGQFDEAVNEKLRKGFAAYINAGGAISLERCLRLTRGNKSFRKAQRNHWLVEVARSTEGKTPWARCVATCNTLDTFISRGIWHAWRDRDDPPVGTSNLRVALFYAAKYNEGMSLSPKQLDRIVGHIFR